MKKIIEKIRHRNGPNNLTCPYWVFTLECGHQIQRGGHMHGGFSAYSKAEGQKRAKCPECES